MSASPDRPAAVAAVVAWYAPSDVAAVATDLGADPLDADHPGGAAARRRRRRRSPRSGRTGQPDQPRRPPTAPPILLLHGRADRLDPLPCRASGCTRALVAAGADAHLHLYDDADHMWLGAAGGGGRRGRSRTIAFLRITRASHGTEQQGDNHENRRHPTTGQPAGPGRCAVRRRAQRHGDRRRCAEFWADAAGYLTARLRRRRPLAVADVRLVPPVLPGRPGDLHRAELPQARRRGQLPATRPCRSSRRCSPAGPAVADRRRRRRCRCPSNEDGLDWEGEIVAWVGVAAGRRHPERGAGRRRRLLDVQRPHLPPRPEAHLAVDPRQERRQLRPARPDGARPPRSATCATGCGCRPGSTAPPCRTAPPTRWSTPSATPSRSSRTPSPCGPGDLLATGTPSGVGYARTPPVAAAARRRRRGRGRAARRAAQHRRRQRRPAHCRLTARPPDRERPAMSGEFRQYLFPHDHPRLAEVRGLDAYAYREAARTPGTFTGDLVAGWTPLYRNEFRGVTENGTLREDVHPLEPGPARRGGAGRRDGRRRPWICWPSLDDDGRARISYPGRRRASGRPGPTRSSCSSTPGCGWSSSRPRSARQRAGPGAGVAEPRGLRAGAHHDADQRLPRRGRRPGTDPQRVQLQHRPLRRPRSARAVGLAAVRPPLRGELPGRRGPDGAVAGLPRCRTRTRSTRGPHAGVDRRSPSGSSSGIALMAALPDGSATSGDRLRADGRPGDAARPGASRRRAAPGRRVPGQPGHPVRGHPRRRHARRRTGSGAGDRRTVRPAAAGRAPRRPAAGDPRTPGRDLVLAGSAATSPATSSTTASSPR